MLDLPTARARVAGCSRAPSRSACRYGVEVAQVRPGRRCEPGDLEEDASPDGSHRPDDRRRAGRAARRRILPSRRPSQRRWPRRASVRRSRRSAADDRADRRRRPVGAVRDVGSSASSDGSDVRLVDATAEHDGRHRHRTGAPVRARSFRRSRRRWRSLAASGLVPSSCRRSSRSPCRRRPR